MAHQGDGGGNTAQSWIWRLVPRLGKAIPRRIPRTSCRGLMDRRRTHMQCSETELTARCEGRLLIPLGIREGKGLTDTRRTRARLGLLLTLYHTFTCAGRAQTHQTAVSASVFARPPPTLALHLPRQSRQSLRCTETFFIFPH
jgi:hypothetical protein